VSEIDRIETLKKINEDINILYVAVTRAKKVLQLNLDLMAYLHREAAE
jgi:ATP-dependent exoDNAse (exonuclease V) beta subunit